MSIQPVPRFTESPDLTIDVDLNKINDYKSVKPEDKQKTPEISKPEPKLKDGGLNYVW
jgi:hypothetical protein